MAVSVLSWNENFWLEWTLILKAIAVAGIVLGMEFLHSVGLIHGFLKPNNVLFDEYHRIRIADFGRSRLDSRESAATPCGAMSMDDAQHPLLFDAMSRLAGDLIG
jgi:serine/threonine protein kinase